MKRKLYLPLIAGIVLLSTVWAVYGKQQKAAPVNQAWEYKTIGIARSAQSNADWSDWAEISGDAIKTLPLPVSVPKKAKELGEQGWELVSITPISNNAGGAGGSNLAGFTSQIMYWFKRPK